MQNFYKNLKQQKGAAFLMILAVFAIILPLIQGIWMDSQIEYRFSRYRMNELQARYNAKSGLGLSLLRIHIFKGIEKSVPKKWIPTTRSLLDLIWSFPFSWPLPIPEDMVDNQKQEMKNLMDQSYLKGSYLIFTSPQDGLLDVNDLSSPLPALREFTREAIMNILLNALEDKPELGNKYSAVDFGKILNNLSDWTDLDNESQNGGREEFLEEGKKPLNRSFISIEEIKKVPGVSLDIFEILKPSITVYGAKALNINYSPMGVLRALNIPESLAKQILIRTQKSSPNYSPFKNQKDFCDFMNRFDFAFCEELKDIYETLDILNFSYPMAFRIKTVGGYRGSFVNLSTLLFDLSSVSLNYQKSRYNELQRQKQKEEGNQSVSETHGKEQSDNNSENTDSKDLKFNYSYGQSLIIMYFKENF